MALPYYVLKAFDLINISRETKWACVKQKDKNGFKAVSIGERDRKDGVAKKLRRKQSQRCLIFFVDNKHHTNLGLERRRHLPRYQLVPVDGVHPITTALLLSVSTFFAVANAAFPPTTT